MATDNVGLQIQIPKDLHTRLKDEADKRLVHPSLLVARAIEKFLADLVPLDQQLRTVHEPAGGPDGDAKQKP